MRVDHLARHAAINGNLLTSDEAGAIGCQKQDSCGDVGGFPNATNRVLLPIDRTMLYGFTRLRFRPRPRLDPARQDGVDPDVGTKADR